MIYFIEMVTNADGIAIIRKYEGFRPQAYKCAAGVWTIGYGHTLGVKVQDRVTVAQAEFLLIHDINTIEEELKYQVKGANVNVNQWSALVSFIYNVGLNAFKDSTLRRFLPYSKTKAADELLKWDKVAGKPLPGLTARRADERELFLK